MSQCKICGFKDGVGKGIKKHLRLAHSLDDRSYYEQYVAKAPECPECGKIVDKFISVAKGFRKFCSESCGSRYTARVEYRSNPKVREALRPSKEVLSRNGTNTLTKLWSNPDYRIRKLAHLRECQLRWVNSEEGKEVLRSNWYKNHKIRTPSRSHEYDGILFLSNWEVVCARELDNLGIKWQYESRRVLLEGRTRLPDFYLPEYDLFLEVKMISNKSNRPPWSWSYDQVMTRTKQMFQQGYKYLVVEPNSLKSQLLGTLIALEEI